MSGRETEEDAVFCLSLRPKKLCEFIGQEETVESLKIAIAAARQRKEPLDHVFLSGPPGLGKTALSFIIAQEMGTKVTATSGPAIERAGDLIGILTNLDSGDVLFIDEIHRMSKVVEEFLYPAMENFQIDFIIDKGPYARTIKFNLKRFTLIGATTRSGMLSAALRSRFGIFYHFDFYPPRDLSQIVVRSAGLLGINIEPDAALEIARRSRGTPRIANRLLRRVRDYAQVKSRADVISKDIAAQALSCLRIDEKGLDDCDRRVLRAIVDFYSGGPVGIDSLAATLNEERDTLVDTVEPYLLKIGYLKRTARGRSLGDAAYDHLGVTRRRQVQGELFR